MKCLVPTCDKCAFARGLCRSCYQQASRLVKRNLTTWEQLEADGKVNEKYIAYRYSETVQWLLGESE